MSEKRKKTTHLFGFSAKELFNNNLHNCNLDYCSIILRTIHGVSKQIKKIK